MWIVRWCGRVSIGCHVWRAGHSGKDGARLRPMEGFDEFPLGSGSAVMVESGDGDERHPGDGIRQVAGAV